MTLSVAPAHVWEFDSSLADAVGGWTLAGTVTYGTGKLGNALNQLKYATYTSGVYSLAAGDWSISAWVKPTNSYSGDNLTFLQIGGIDCTITATNVGDDQISVTDTEGNGIAARSTVASLFTLNTWYHIVITRASAGNVLKMYLNGTLIRTTTLVAITDPFGIVACGDRDGMYISTDQIGIFEAVLTADDATYLYNSGTGRAYADWFGPPAVSTITSDDRTITFRR